MAAYDLYLKGREYFLRYRKHDNENAIELYRKALDLDPNYALAYAGLSSAYTHGADLFGYPRSLLDTAIETAQKAVDIDLNLADAHASLGFAYSRKGQMRKALEALKTAFLLNPKDYLAISLLAYTQRKMGQFDEALPLSKKAVILNPKSFEPYLMTGYIYWDLVDYERAEEWAQKSLEVAPDNTFSYALLIMTYFMRDQFVQAEQVSKRMILLYPENAQTWGCAGNAATWAGDHAKAQEYLEKAIRLGPTSWNQSVVHSTWLGYVYWKTGKRTQAEEMFAESLRFNQNRIETGDQSHYPSLDLTFVYAVQGKKKEAYRWLQKTIDAGFRWYDLFLKHPLLENLHNDQRFIQMMRQLEVEVDEMRKRIEAMEQEGN
jgi:protein kinase/serine/threonine-protein kinase